VCSAVCATVCIPVCVAVCVAVFVVEIDNMSAKHVQAEETLKSQIATQFTILDNWYR